MAPGQTPRHPYRSHHDIDYFKKYNGTYGHLAGDDCLKKAARAMTSALKRPADLLARFGGEEFAAVLPETDQESAGHVAGMPRASVAELNLEHELSGKGGRVTVSLGVASQTPEGCRKKIEDLMTAGDAALYRAKRNGRDLVALSKREQSE